jgi:hypothetical protein
LFAESKENVEQSKRLDNFFPSLLPVKIVYSYNKVKAGQEIYDYGKNKDNVKKRC